MKAPQIIIIVLYALSLGMYIAKHKEKKEGSMATYNAWTAAFTAIITLGLLYWGGFFNV